jgi:ADP-ribose pyrophosphatase YjhB (NUDIX family)
MIRRISMNDYIKWIRGKVGHDVIIINCSIVCITNEKGEILLQKRSEKDDVWGLLGGAVEIGESIEEAAIREVKEETGLDIKIDYLVGVYSKYFIQYPNGDSVQAICNLFKGSVTGGYINIDNIETFDLQFFDKDNIPRLFFHQHIDMLNDFFENRTGVFR